MLCRRTPFRLRYLSSLYHSHNVPGSHKIQGFFLISNSTCRTSKGIKASETMSTTHRVCFPKREQQLHIPRVTPSFAHRQGLLPLRAYVVGAEGVD